MITKLFIKPVEGLLVRDEKTKMILPPEGKEVLHSTYWERRIQCGDVIVVPSVEKKEEIAPEEKPESVKKSKKEKQGDE